MQPGEFIHVTKTHSFFQVTLVMLSVKDRVEHSLYSLDNLSLEL